MSLLYGRHVVEVLEYEDVKSESWGLTERCPTGQRIAVPCIVQWQDAAEVIGLVSEPATAVKVLALEWPGEPQDHFCWDGYEFEQVGPRRCFTGSTATRHYEVFARMIGKESANA